MKQLLIIMIVMVLGCENNNADRYIVRLQLSPFEISGNGSKLAFPVWAETVDLNEIETAIHTMEEIHQELEKIYGQKHFTSLGIYNWDGIISTDQKINRGKPIFENILPGNYIGDFEAEVMFSEMEGERGDFIFRVKRIGDTNGGTKYLPIHVQNRNSVSVGSFYQEDGNKGILFVLAMENMKLKSNTTNKQIVRFFKNSIIVHDILPPEKWAEKIMESGVNTMSYSSWSSKINENEKTIDLRNTIKQPKATFIPYDSPPKPLSSISPVFPESARKDSITGHVILQVFIKEDGKTGEVVVLRGIRDDLNNAAINAIQFVEWEPAKNKGIPVGVWISIPVNFQLN